jgi:23S rRNA (cytosine1962-C5)-methyltransferase
MRISILYQDSDIVVVNKPAGIPTHAPDPGDPYPGDALRIVQAQTGLPYLGMHQRLDADTSGVLLFAARRAANKALAAAFEGREVRKIYLALVHGAPPRTEGVIDEPIAREHGERYRTTAPGDPRGLAARTRYRVLKTYPVLRLTGMLRDSPYSVAFHEQRPSSYQSCNTQSHEGASRYAIRNRAQPPTGAHHAEPPHICTLLELIPETGRPHQIRVHLAHIGCPVVGDPLYGPVDRPAPRLYLHACQLTLPHPVTGQPVTFTAPVPELPRTGGDGSIGNRPEPGPSLRGSHFGPKQSRTSAHQIASRRSQDMDSGEFEGREERFGTSQRPSASADSPLPASAKDALIFGLQITHLRDAVVVPDALRALLLQSIDRRAPLAADPQTDIYRLLNGAADGLPGLTVDRYGSTLVAAIYDGDVMPPRPLPGTLVDMLAETTDVRAIYLKYRPKEAGRIADDQLAALAPAQPIYGPDLGEFVAHEEGLAYVIRPGDGLSTGLFPDMREGRARVRAWAAGRRVLNTFAYTCGFGVAATAGGAQRVLNLDLSKSVLEWGQANYRANGFEPDPHDFVFGDVFDWLARLAKRGDRFDLVILDPPGFSRTKSRAFSAARDYGDLAGLAARVTVPGGWVLACCNVAGLSWRSFRERVLAGIAAAGRTSEVNGVYHEPMLDFPTPMRGEPYLKMALVEVR